jgi:hypothetical protein
MTLALKHINAGQSRSLLTTGTIQKQTQLTVVYNAVQSRSLLTTGTIQTKICFSVMTFVLIVLCF